MLGSLIGLVMDLDRKVLAVGAVLVIVVFSAVGYFVFSGGGGGSSGGDVDLGQQIDFSAVGDSGGSGRSEDSGESVQPAAPALLDESVVAERVAATIEAMVRRDPGSDSHSRHSGHAAGGTQVNRARSDRILQLDPP